MIVGSARWPCWVTFHPRLSHPCAIHTAIRREHDATAKPPAPRGSNNPCYVALGVIVRVTGEVKVVLVAVGALVQQSDGFCRSVRR